MFAIYLQRLILESPDFYEIACGGDMQLTNMDFPNVGVLVYRLLNSIGNDSYFRLNGREAKKLFTSRASFNKNKEAANSAALINSISVRNWIVV